MAGLSARLVLAAVLAVAAIAKLSDRRRSREAFVAFGLPHRLAGPAALAAALAELVVAILLVPTSTAVAGALGALVLLAAFSAMVAGALARGSAPDCGCFGSLTDSRVSGWTLVRNALLGGLAIVALVAGPVDSAIAWMGICTAPSARDTIDSSVNWVRCRLRRAGIWSRRASRTGSAVSDSKENP